MYIPFSLYLLLISYFCSKDSLKLIPNFFFIQYNTSPEEGHPIIDYTPPSYITLLFTEIGVLTPSAVSDELINLYC